MKLSIVIPFYNEAATLETIVRQVLSVDLAGWDREIVLVNDGSSDRSAVIAEDLRREYPDVIQFLSHNPNQGKGAAVIKGLRAATGDVLIVQDADLEYDPNDFRKILACYSDQNVQVVFGSRILGSTNRSYHRYYWGGRLVTWFTNIIYGSHITDEPTCYKSLRRSVLESMPLTSRGFEFCPEITAKILLAGIKIHEVPISYAPRSFEEGKKINAKDGLIAIWTLLKYRFWH